MIAAGHARAIDLGLVADGGPGGRARRSSGSPRPASTATPTGSPTKLRPGSAVSSTSTAPCGRWSAWRPARFEIELDPPGEHHSFTAYTVGAANSQRLRRRHARCPGALLDDGLLDVIVLEHVGKLAFLTRILPKVFNGTHVHEPRRARLPRARARRSAPTGRSRCMPTATRSASCPCACAPCPGRSRCCVPRSRRADPAFAQRAAAAPGADAPRSADGRRAAPSSSRSRGPSARSRACAAAAPRALPGQGPDAPAARCDRHARRAPERSGSVLVSATNGKTTTAAMAAAILERAGIALVHNQAGANMAGGIATTLLGAAGPRRGSPASSGCSRSTSCGSPRSPRARTRGRSCSATCSATSSTATASSRRSPSSWAARCSRAAPHRLVLERRRPAGRRPRPRAPADALLRRRGRLAGAGRAGPRGRRQALPPLRRALRLRRRLPRPSRPLPLPELRPAAPDAGASAPPRWSLARRARARASRCARPPARLGCALALPGPLQRLQRARRRGPGERAGGAAGGDRGGPGETPAGVRARRDASTLEPRRGRRAPAVAERELRILLVKNPAGANEVLRTLALEPGEHDLLGVLNDKIADGRDVSWIWDADFELLAGRIRRVTCSGTRAADLAVRLKYAGVDPDRIHVETDLPARPRRGAVSRADPDARRSTRCPPTRPCSRCASCSSRAARRAARGERRRTGAAATRPRPR